MNHELIRTSLLTALFCLAATISWSQKSQKTATDINEQELRSLQAAPGNIGIDILNPTSKLHVSGDIRIEDPSAFFISNGIGGNAGICMQENAATKAYLYWLASGDVLKLNANTGSGNHLTIKPEGTIGIGTISDSARLHIQGKTSTTGHTVDIDDSSGKNLFTVRDNGNVGINFSSPGNKLVLDGDMSFYNDAEFYGRIAPFQKDFYLNAKFGINLLPPLSSSPAQNIIMQSHIGGGPFFFNFPGKVGIGTSSPEAKLHVSSNVMIGAGAPAAGYALSVNGRVMAEEVRVQLDSAWPDYVFADDYDLMPLKETAVFIESNKHLPGIPSAQEVEQDGIPLGDMNKMLLEKIEELTLHVIQLSAEVSELKKNK